MREIILEFFKLLNEQTKEFVTQIELEPIRIKEDTYITGIKRIGISFFQMHIQNIKHIMLKTNEFTMERALKSEPEEEIWLDIDLIDKDTVNLAFNEIKNKFQQLKTFHVLKMEYRDKTISTADYITHEEIIIFQDKKLACKTAIKKRKQTTSLKTKFLLFGENNIIQKITDEEFAEAAMI